MPEENYYIVSQTDMEDVAGTIRAKGNTVALLSWPTEWKTAINNIQTGANVDITQDQDGYLVLGNQLSSRLFCESETGTFSPSTDTATYNIIFTNSHNKLPFFTIVELQTDSYDSTLNAAHCTFYINWSTLLGHQVYSSSTSQIYGEVRYRYRSTNTSSLSSGGVTISYPDSNTQSSGTSYPRYWATETGMTAYSGNNSIYYKTGSTYKWMAVWSPFT